MVCFIIKAVQQKDTPLSTSTSAVTLVSSSPVATSSPVETDVYIPTASADVAADIAKYTNKVSCIYSCCLSFWNACRLDIGEVSLFCAKILLFFNDRPHIYVKALLLTADNTLLVYLYLLVIFQIMDAIKGTMTEIYNDLSKSTSGNTIAEVSVWPCTLGVRRSDYSHGFACGNSFTWMCFWLSD